MTSFLGVPAYELESGEIMLDPKYYQEYLEKFEEGILGDKTKSFIVLLLGSTGMPIRGRILLIKEAFLFLQDLKGVLIDPPELFFFPHKYGPYSRYLINKLKELRIEGIISIENNKILLNENGKRIFNRMKRTYTAEALQSIVDYRIRLDQKGTDGIMKVVYERFSEYTVKSRVRERYISKKKQNK